MDKRALELGLNMLHLWIECILEVFLVVRSELFPPAATTVGIASSKSNSREPPTLNSLLTTISPRSTHRSAALLDDERNGTSSPTDFLFQQQQPQQPSHHSHGYTAIPTINSSDEVTNLYETTSDTSDDAILDLRQNKINGISTPPRPKKLPSAFMLNINSSSTSSKFQQYVNNIQNQVVITPRSIGGGLGSSSSGNNTPTIKSAHLQEYCQYNDEDHLDESIVKLIKMHVPAGKNSVVDDLETGLVEIIQECFGVLYVVIWESAMEEY
jgi:hypothetical protein